MLFASDLDRTLIYSKRFVNGDEKQIQLVERKGDKEISFMLGSSIKMLKILSDKLLFVPVTTRSIEQYKRIGVFQKEIKPKCFVVSNGGNIFSNGKLDKEWNKIIISKFSNECLMVDEVISEFNKMRFDLNIETYQKVDDLFFYCTLERDVQQEVLDIFSTWLERNGWRSILNGRKLYFVPKHINKGEAVKYIADKRGAKHIITSGDSLLDYDMVSVSNLFISPQHGSISEVKNYDNSVVKFTTKSGIYASHEILEAVLKEVI